MRKTLLFLLLLSAKLTFGQFFDNFNDGNFTDNPVWSGQTSSFNINASKQLKSSLSAVAQTVSLCTSSSLALNAKWEFSVQLNFDPSTTNLTRIYLMADQEDLRGNLNGYFIQIGESGSADSYDLYKQTGNSISKIIDGLPKNRANINYLSTKLRITRDDFGKWELYTSFDEGATYTLEGSTIDKTFTSTNWFGVYCKYTASRSDGFVFDDFKVEELVSDSTPPSLLSINVVDDFTLEATFSEPLAINSALIARNYLLKEPNEYPISIDKTASSNVFSLSFAHPFKSGYYTLIANGVGDLKGNKVVNSEASTFYIEAYTALKGDVVINEIFADPSPQIGLPAAEFIELWNTTDKYIILTGWKYKDLTSTFSFLADTIRPNEYVILCAEADVNLFKVFGKTIGLSTWPMLNNDKDRLSLISPQNIVIDSVFYTDKWYKDGLKSQGGYSLELIDPKNRCVGMQNWQASMHSSGGTLGAKNSVYQLQLHTQPLKIRAASILDQTTIVIHFSESIDSLSGALIGNYNLNNGMGKPLSSIPQSPDFKSVVLKLGSPITKGQEYVLTVNTITNCAGNTIDQAANSATLFMARDIGVNDILISEVLVNPKQGGIDFIEIYNATDHVLDLATLKLGNTDANGNMANVKTISSNTVYIPSKAFWVLATDLENIKRHFEVKNQDHFTKMVSLPAFNNEKGTVILLGSLGVVDRFDYHEKMHFPLLQIVKGVSLERVSFLKPTNEKGNFKSAAQASGFGTPSSKNSQTDSVGIANEVWLSTKTFSPDGDGFEDILQINYQLADQDYLANVTVYNDKGIVVKKILRNSTIPKMGYLVWNGLKDDGSLSKVGIYSIKFEVFTLSGKTKSFEKVCVLAAKL